MNWNELLWKAVKETSRADVARKLGVSRTSVSLLLANKYPGTIVHMVRRINTVFAHEATHICPRTGVTITRDLSFTRNLLQKHFRRQNGAYRIICNP